MTKIGRPTEYPELIKSELKEGSLPGKILLENIYKKLCPDLYSPENEKRRYNNVRKCLNEALLNLMDKDEIQIIKYDQKFDKRKRKHAFTLEGFIFSLVELNPMKLRDLINKAFEEEYQYNALRNLFTNKLRTIESRKIQEWNLHESWLNSKSLSDDEILWYNFEVLYDDGRFPSFMYDKGPEEHYKFAKSYIKENKYLIQELREKIWKGIKLWYFKNKPLEMSVPIKDCYNARYLRNNYIFTDNLPINKEKFIEKELGFSKPKKISDDEIESIFNQLMRYIDFQSSENRKILINKLSYALTDDNEFEKYLDEIISETTVGKGKL